MSTSIKNLRQLAARDVKDHTAIFDSYVVLGRDIDYLARLSEEPNLDGILVHVTCEIAFCPHDLAATGSAVAGEAAHGEVYGASVGVFDVGHLMVHHVVVTVVDTAAVRTCLYGFVDRVRRRMEG